MNWLSFAVLSATSFGFYNFFTKLASERLSPTVAFMFLSGAAFLVAAASTIFLKLSWHQLDVSKEDIVFPILAGIATGVAEILYLSMFSKGVSLNLGAPLVIGMTIAFTTVLSFLILKEPLSLTRIGGIVFVVAGAVLLSRS